MTNWQTLPEKLDHPLTEWERVRRGLPHQHLLCSRAIFPHRYKTSASRKSGNFLQPPFRHPVQMMQPPNYCHDQLEPIPNSDGNLSLLNHLRFTVAKKEGCRNTWHDMLTPRTATFFSNHLHFHLLGYVWQTWLFRWICISLYIERWIFIV